MSEWHLQHRRDRDREVETEEDKACQQKMCDAAERTCERQRQLRFEYAAGRGCPPVLMQRACLAVVWRLACC